MKNNHFYQVCKDKEDLLHLKIGDHNKWINTAFFQESKIFGHESYLHRVQKVDRRRQVVHKVKSEVIKDKDKMFY